MAAATFTPSDEKFSLVRPANDSSMRRLDKRKSLSLGKSARGRPKSLWFASVLTKINLTIYNNNERHNSTTVMKITIKIRKKSNEKEMVQSSPEMECVVRWRRRRRVDVVGREIRLRPSLCAIVCP